MWVEKVIWRGCKAASGCKQSVQRVGLRYSNSCVIGCKLLLEPQHGINGVADVVIVNTAVKQLSCIELSCTKPLPLLLDAIVQPLGMPHKAEHHG